MFRVVYGRPLSEKFEVITEVRQGCLLSPFLFLLVIDWIMKTTTKGRKHGIQWGPWIQLDDLDFADDLALSHNQRQMQDKTTQVATNSAKSGVDWRSRVIQVPGQHHLNREVQTKMC